MRGEGSVFPAARGGNEPRGEAVRRACPLPFPRSCSPPMVRESWYIDAVIYGIDVKKFANGNGDGTGDFIGLAERLPYIADLRVPCLRLLPFFGSTGKRKSVV